MSGKRYEIDMCSGPLFSKVLRFALPLMLSTALQLLFNAVDMVVVGRFSGSDALAAVGATGSLTNLLVGVFVGLSVGTNVLVARYCGAQDARNISETVHTSILISLIFGAFLAVLGFCLAPPMLRLMGTPDGVLEQAVLYIRIYFLGMPVIILYNFGSAVLRAVGDTQRPLYFLTAAGVLNVALNLFFVIVLRMGVAGVALATVLSQALSAGLVVLCLIRSDAVYRLHLKKLRVHWDKLWEITRIGLPAGLQGAIFSLSNVLIQSSINSFGAAAIAGNTASSNIEGIICTTFSGAIYQANLSFVSQNVGAKKYSRVNKIVLLCCAMTVIGSVVLGFVTWSFGQPLLSIYTSDPEVIRCGLLRMGIMASLFFLAALMDCMVGAMRGIGYSVLPMIVSLTGACGLRIVWLYTIFAARPTLQVLYISYPFTWGVTALTHIICFLIVRRKLPKTDLPLEA